jgi:hypothetical protein
MREVCPAEEESGILVLSSSVKCSHVWMGGGKRRCLGPCKGPSGAKMGQLVQSMEPVGIEVCILVQRASTSSKRALFTSVNTILYQTCIIIIIHSINCLYLDIFLSSAG